VRRAARGALALVLASFLPAGAWAKESALVIVAGLGGDESRTKQFHEWATAMRDAAIRSGLPPDRVFYLGENPEAAPQIVHAKSTKENVTAVFRKLEGMVSPGDAIFVLLLGHGSYDSDEPRFNLPGRDLTASDFDALLGPFGEQRVVFVNTASASGAFLPVLAKPNRIVVTSTKSGFERNESQFGKYFVEAYSSPSAEADADKNEKVSVLEAFEFARLAVESYYQEQNLLLTEHAQLDDDGDGKGVAQAGEAEGRFAGSAYLVAPGALAEGISPEAIAADPELARLVEKKAELEGRVEALRLSKDTMPEDVYLKELEELLLELARISQILTEKGEK
jgi:hypothetical protein